MSSQKYNLRSRATKNSTHPSEGTPATTQASGGAGSTHQPAQQLRKRGRPRAPGIESRPAAAPRADGADNVSQQSPACFLATNKTASLESIPQEILHNIFFHLTDIIPRPHPLHHPSRPPAFPKISGNEIFKDGAPEHPYLTVALVNIAFNLMCKWS